MKESMKEVKCKSDRGSKILRQFGELFKVRKLSRAVNEVCKAEKSALLSPFCCLMKRNLTHSIR